MHHCVCTNIGVHASNPLQKLSFSLIQINCESSQIAEWTEPTGSRERGEWACRRDVLQRLLFFY